MSASNSYNSHLTRAKSLLMNALANSVLGELDAIYNNIEYIPLLISVKRGLLLCYTYCRPFLKTSNSLNNQRQLHTEIML